MLCLLTSLLALTTSTCARAASPDDVKGLWPSSDGDAVIEFEPCPEAQTALCGTIVWDKDAGTSADSCGIRIAKLQTYDDGAWRNGWVYDPRNNKHYKGAVRADGETIAIRAFIGTEILGETETLSRVHTLPATPVCKTRKDGVSHE
jgi:uncharacterized protein (DUF2147 family)